MTNRSEIFRTAHEIARREMKVAPKFWGSYAAAFADALRAVYATERYDADCDAKYGPGMVPAFTIQEPARWLGFSHK